MNFRKMYLSDADFMLTLKNYPETRKYAIASHDEIKREDHYKWLETNIKYFQIIELVDKAIGAVRIQDGEISIWIDKEFWGKRVATMALNSLVEKGMWCKIVNGNVGSFKAFVRAGFVPVHYEDNYYILKK